MVASPTELRSIVPTRSRDRFFDAEAKIQGGTKCPLAAHQPARHLVDGADGRHRHAAFHGFHDAVMVLGVELVAAFHQHNLRAHALGVGNNGSGPHAERLGLVAGRNAAGGVGHHGHHAYGPAAQLGPRLLLDAGKVGVQIDEEPVQQALGRTRLFGGVRPSRASGPNCEVRKLFRPLLGNGRKPGVLTGRWGPRISTPATKTRHSGPRIGNPRHTRTIFAFSSLLCN